VSAWLRHHRRAAYWALRKLAAQGSGGLLSILVIGIALALPAGGYALLGSLRGLAGGARLEPQISLFLHAETKRADAQALGARLRADPRIQRARFVPREEALKDLESTEGVAQLVEALGRNPLPDAYVLIARDPAAAALESLAAELRRLPQVAHVQVDSSWARRLEAFAALLRLGLALVGGLLGLGLAAVTFNTIRLQILTQRDEIQVSMLVGASDAFVRRPYFYLGGLQGLAGGALAVAIVWGGILALNSQVAALAQAYGSSFRFAPLAPREALAMLGLAGTLGWLGAYLSVSRYLRETHRI